MTNVGYLVNETVSVIYQSPMSKSELVIAEIKGCVRVLAVGESTTETKGVLEAVGDTIVTE